MDKVTGMPSMETLTEWAEEIYCNLRLCIKGVQNETDREGLELPLGQLGDFIDHMKGITEEKEGNT